jgi:hypothetical protein
MADTNRRVRDAGGTTVSTTATEDGGPYGFANRRRRSHDCVDSDIDGGWETALFTLLDRRPSRRRRWPRMRRRRQRLKIHGDQSTTDQATSEGEIQ